MSSASHDHSAFVVVLTGGIASGKSATAQRFSERGVPLFDADEVAHRIVQPGGSSLGDIERQFGASMLTETGELDRKRMRELVFTDASARRKLESILHPRIHDILVQNVASSEAPYCLLAIPLFYECRDAYGWVDRILVTDVPRAMQIERLLKRPQIDRPLAERILDTQASRQQRLDIADDVIDNTGPITRLASVVGRLHEHYLELAAAKRI
ncbi:MAG: dephospho-CoA kinase [Rudaea sp.]